MYSYSGPDEGRERHRAGGRGRVQLDWFDYHGHFNGCPCCSRWRLPMSWMRYYLDLRKVHRDFDRLRRYSDLLWGRLDGARWA